MNGKLLISLFAGLLLAVGASAAWAKDVKCEPIPESDKDVECQGLDHYPLVTINTVTHEVSPEFVCAARGTVIEFRVFSPGKTDSDSVDVKAKDQSNTWLIGANFLDKMKIKMRVPLWVEYGKNQFYFYNIFFEDGTCVDPRVHVTR